MLRVTYIGHATLLIELGHRRLLTDPNFDPALGKFLRRVSLPGIPLGDLPKLDAILLTHAHADHLSFNSLDALPSDIPLFAPPAIAKWLSKQGYSHVVPLAPGEDAQVDGVNIKAASATHRGNRYGVDRWRSSANMYLVDTNKVSCFFAGDTALTSDTTHLVERQLLESLTDDIGRKDHTSDGDFVALPDSGRGAAVARRSTLTAFDDLTSHVWLPVGYLAPPEPSTR